jgi:hypothetical protein
MFEIRFNSNGKNQSIAVFETMAYAEKFLKLCEKPNTKPVGKYDIMPVTLSELKLRAELKKKEQAKKKK